MGSDIVIPTEILNEIIAYLWNDIPSLKACSLAHRSLTVLSQKRLFYSIGLQQSRKDVNSDTTFLNCELTGTSYDFWRLLVGSPHIADYVQSLSIRDSDVAWHPADNPPISDGEYSRALLYEGYRSESQGSPIKFKERERRRARIIVGREVASDWLANDKYLPYCALRLQNLKAFAFIYFQQWDFFPSPVYIALLRLIRLPSLLHVRIKWDYPAKLFQIAIGDNLKHLVLQSGTEPDILPILPKNPSTKRVYIDSLEIYCSDCIVDHDLKNPNCRIDLSRLRRLVISWHGDGVAEYASVWALLQICRQTLEEFEFTLPHYEWTRDDPGTRDKPDLIDLSKLTSLKKLTVNLNFVSAFYFRWLNRILRPPNNTVNTAPLDVEDISIILSDRVRTLIPAHLKKIFDVLLDRRFRTLRLFSIFFAHGPTDLVDVLDGSEMVETLRSQRGVVVDIRACRRSSPFETDVRWQTPRWKKWNHVEACSSDDDF